MRCVAIITIIVALLLLFSIITSSNNAPQSNRLSSDWRMPRHDAQNTHRSDAKISIDNPKILWKKRFPNCVGPLIFKNKLYMFSYYKLYVLYLNGTLDKIIEQPKLTKIIRREIIEEIGITQTKEVLSPLVKMIIGEDGIVYGIRQSIPFPLAEKKVCVYAINQAGEVVWKTKFENVDEAEFILFNSTLYVELSNSTIYALDSTTGDTKWFINISSEADNQSWCHLYPLAMDVKRETIYGKIFYLNTSSAYIYSLSINDKKLNWMIPFNHSGGVMAVGDNGIIYVPTYHGLYAINSNGSIAWVYNKTGVGDVAIGRDGTIYKWSAEEYCIDYIGAYYTGAGIALSPNGTELWRIPMGFRRYGLFNAPSIDGNGIIYFTNDEGYLYAVNPIGKIKWRFKVCNSTLSSPVIGPNNTIYVVDINGYLYAIGEKSTYAYLIAMIGGGLVVATVAVIYLFKYTKKRKRGEKNEKINNF